MAGKHGSRRHSTTSTFSEIRELKGDVTRDDSQRRLLVATRRCNIGLNSCNIVPTLQRFVPTTTATSTRTANNRLDWQNSNPRLHRAFLPSLHDYDLKMPNFLFYGGRELKTTTFLFFS